VKWVLDTSWLSITSFGFLGSKSEPNIVRLYFVSFFGLLIIALLGVKKTTKKLLFSLMTIGLIMGFLGEKPIYHFIFNFVPLFKTFRSAYRFVIFEQIALIVTLAILASSIYKDKYHKVIINYFLLILLITNFCYIFQTRNVLNNTKLPKEYGYVFENIKKNQSTRYLYLPSMLALHHHISFDYSYGNTSGLFFWWQNPFESWYPSRNVHHPTLNMTAAELNEAAYDAYQENKQNELISLLKRAGVEKIIIDKYYYWSREAPKFDISLFLSKQDLKLERDFGQIEIYSIN